MSKVKFGVVGMGDVASHTYMPGISSFSNVDLVAVCDIVEERAQWGKAEFGAKEYYTDVDEMLEKADIEAVVDLTPIVEHGALNQKVLQANKHLYTEKSMATTMEDADAIVEGARKAGLKLACAPPVLLSPLNVALKRLLGTGIIGKIAFVRAHSSHFGASEFDGYLSDPTWFFKPGGGPIFDMGVYAVQTLTGLLGPARRITVRPSLTLVTAASTPLSARLSERFSSSPPPSGPTTSHSSGPSHSAVTGPAPAARPASGRVSPRAFSAAVRKSLSATVPRRLT